MLPYKLHGTVHVEIVMVNMEKLLIPQNVIIHVKVMQIRSVAEAGEMECTLQVTNTSNSFQSDDVTGTDCSHIISNDKNNPACTLCIAQPLKICCV